LQKTGWIEGCPSSRSITEGREVTWKKERVPALAGARWNETANKGTIKVFKKREKG